MAFDDTFIELRDRFESVTYDRPVEDVYRGLRRHRRRRGLAATLTATLIVAAVLVGWQPFGRQPSAIAGWTTEPHPGDPATVAAVDAQCRTMITSLGTELRLPYPYPGELGWTDQRGNGIILVYPTPDGIGLCLNVVGDDFGGGGAGSPTEFGPLTGTLRVDVIQGLDLHRGDTGVTAVVGQAAPEVTRVVVTAPGWAAEASQHDGYWLAWWPAATDAADITVNAYNESGTLVDTWTHD